MLFQKISYQFITQLKNFDYQFSGLDPVWKVLFQTPNGKWHHVHITKYEKTYYIHHLFNKDLGTPEVIPGKLCKISEPNDFYGSSRMNEKNLIKHWEAILGEAIKWLKTCSKNWVKANKYLQAQYPLKYRYGTIAGSLIREKISDSFRLDRAVGKIRARKFVHLVERNYFLNEQYHTTESMTAGKFFDYCKIAYLAAASPKDSLDKTMSGRAMYQRFADGRHEGLLDIDPNSEQEFADWLDGKHPKRERGGHPWEIKRGGSYTHIGLRVQRPSYVRREGFKMELYGNSNTRLAETIKMFLAIHQADQPITIADPNGIRKRLLGQDNFGIIPAYESLSLADQHFLPEEAVYDAIYYNDLGRYKKQMTPFIRWESLPLLRPRYF